MAALKSQWKRQLKMWLKTCGLWKNPYGLVFTDETGAPLHQKAVGYWPRAVTDDAGLKHICFNDIRYTYAVNALCSGDRTAVVQENLGLSNILPTFKAIRKPL